MTTTLSTPTTVVPVDRSRFQALLAELRSDAIRERELALAETTTAMPDAVAVSRAGRLARTIEEIEAALGRVADGSYGSCVHCGTAIPAERLEFRPYAAGCVACAQER
jgi:RNA polymerase-binding transcription factor DksA